MHICPFSMRRKRGLTDDTRSEEFPTKINVVAVNSDGEQTWLLDFGDSSLFDEYIAKTEDSAVTIDNCRITEDEGSMLRRSRVDPVVYGSINSWSKGVEMTVSETFELA